MVVQKRRLWRVWSGVVEMDCAVEAMLVFCKQKTAYEILTVTGVQTCALPISLLRSAPQGSCKFRSVPASWRYWASITPASPAPRPLWLRPPGAGEQPADPRPVDRRADGGLPGPARGAPRGPCRHMYCGVPYKSHHIPELSQPVPGHLPDHP